MNHCRCWLETLEPSVLQVQYSLLDRRPENGMSDFCLQHGIGILPYGVLAGGFLSDKYLGLPSSKWVLKCHALCSNCI